MSMLSDLGFRADIDSDGDIRFNYEGKTYYITSNCDDTFFYIVCPAFWTLDNKTEQLAGLLAASSTSRRVKAAKVWVASGMDRVDVTLECLIGEPSDVRSFLMRGLRSMQQAVSIFREEMRGLMS
jgi:hypothetical protein